MSDYNNIPQYEDFDGSLWLNDIYSKIESAVNEENKETVNGNTNTEIINTEQEKLTTLAKKPKTKKVNVKNSEINKQPLNHDNTKCEHRNSK